MRISYPYIQQYYIDITAQASLLTRQQLDLVLLGSVMSTTAVDKDVVHGRHRPTKRQRLSTRYMHRGYQLCKNTYNFLYGLGKHRVPTIRKNFISNGLEMRIHGNTKRAPHHASSFSTIKNTIVSYQTMRSRMQSFCQVVYLTRNGMTSSYCRHLIAKW